MKKGFTLAEIMIALVVIGIITSILLPVAFNNVPNENVMKFKKGNATLAKVINELVTSGEYYKEGDLGVKADGTIVDGTHNGDYSYFCKTIADILNTKNADCDEKNIGTADYYVSLDVDHDFEQYKNNPQGWSLIDGCDLSNINCWFDSSCKYTPNKVQAITTIDNIVFYQTTAVTPFGAELFKGYLTDIGKPRNYKYFCMDIDGINQGEDPFGYGIRVDGKIILSARAQEWIEKSIQEK